MSLFDENKSIRRSVSWQIDPASMMEGGNVAAQEIGLRGLFLLFLVIGLIFFWSLNNCYFVIKIVTKTHNKAKNGPKFRRI